MTIRIRDDEGFVEFIGDGEISLEEMIDTMRGFYSNTPRKLALWDHRKSIVSSFSAANFKSVAAVGEELAVLRGPGARNAFLMKDSQEVLFGRAYAAVANATTSVENRAFGDRDAAIAWLLSEDAAEV